MQPSARVVSLHEMSGLRIRCSLFFYIIFSETPHLAWKISQVQLIEEDEPTSPHDLTIDFSRNDDDAISDEVNDRNYHDERTVVTISPLESRTVNETLSNGVPSSPINFSREIEHGANSPTRKRKSTPNAWNSITRTKSVTDLSTEHERMTHLHANHAQTLRRTKDKVKGAWLNARAL